jgi:ATP-dependent helicase HrpA
MLRRGSRPPAATGWSIIVTASLAELRARLPELTLRDERRLTRRVDRARSLRGADTADRATADLAAEVAAAEQRVAARRAAVPVITYPAELPVSQRKTELAAAIASHQVVIVAGETGSGKTTQLPKICLELGRGVRGQIGHTQPRRIAARTVAARIAAELSTELGSAVGYKVRFADTSSDDALITVMTDGILLTELHRDPLLLRYDTLIIDEAHERSLNIDFILGYLRQLLPRRPDLKVIITSATIDPERFSRHFAAGGGPDGRAAATTSAESVRVPPVIEVSGRTYPVEVRYRPLADPDQPSTEARDQVQGIVDAVAELRREGPGDVLVFLSGEREIRDTAEALAGEPGLEVLPLYARLSAGEQYRVFEPHQGRRVVLATNVAETSLTVPGIRYVVDPGTARISRYSQRTKVQRLPIESISQASSNQRKGRCGRTSDGVCIRLYSEADFQSRPEFTEPEILRTNLASVILRMAALDLGAVADFPFVDPPDSRQVADGLRLLTELGAISSGGEGGSVRLTDIGRRLAELPVDPRLGRMILAAGPNGCAREVLIIASALAIQDARERPADAREAADAQHRRFAEPGSDFLSLVTLWDYVRDQQRQLSSSAFRRLCRREYLHFLRVREWQDVYGQLQRAARDVGVAIGRDRRAAPQPPGAEGTGAARYPAELADRVHQSLLAGLLSHIGMRDAATAGGERRGAERGPGGGTGARRRGPAEFLGARGARFAIFPDSPQARRPPSWLMAAELVETSRLWARTVARIEPEWAESLAADLVHRSYSEPRWDARRAAVMATEKVTLYGLPIVAARPVNYGRIDPAAAREIFIQHALVEGDWQTHHAFFARNQRAREEAAGLESKARRRGLVVDDATIFDFYDQRIPETVTSGRHFDSWWKQARRAEPGLLDLGPADLAAPAADEVRADDYPPTWGALPLSYEFAPGEAADGVTVTLPLADVLNRDPAEFSWQVPGLRVELVTELIRALPKELRRQLIPAPDTARSVVARLGEPHGGLAEALSAELTRMTGIVVPVSAWNFAALPSHLRINYQVADGDAVLATGRDLTELRRELRPRLQAALAAAAGDLTRTGLRTWDFGTLPRVFPAESAEAAGEPAGGPAGGPEERPAGGQSRIASLTTDQGANLGVGRSPRLRGYPALVDAGDAVDIRIFDTRAEADAAMRLGTRRLLLIAVPSGVRSIAARLPVAEKMAMSRHPYRNAAALLDDCAAAAADQVIDEAGGAAFDAAGFARLVERARDRLAPATARVVESVARVLGEAHEAEIRLADAHPVPALEPALADVRAQFGRLIYPGFVSATGARRVPDLVRYLRAMVRRLDKLAGEQVRDAERMAAVHRTARAYEARLQELPPEARFRPDVQAVRWLIEELRVSLFAQILGTPVPVSEKRILAAIAALPSD